MSTYYVSTPAGDDGNSGLSELLPWLTINKVNTSGFSAGDSILFNKTCTWREQLTVPSSGSVGSPITFGAYGSGADPIISAADLVTGWSVPPAGGETGGIFVADAEDGGTTDLTGVSVGGTTTFAASTASKNNGSYGYEVTSDGTNDGIGYKTFAAQNTIYVRIYFKVTSGFAINTDFKAVSPLLLKDAGGTVRARINLRRNGTGFDLGANMPWGGWGSIGNTAFTANAWHYIELYYLVHATTGGIQLWVDGVSKGTSLTTNTTGTAIARIDTGLVNVDGIPTAGSVVYIDDIKADTSAVGAYSGGADAPEGAYQATVAYAPTIVIENGTKLTNVANLAAITSAGKWYYDSGATLLYVRGTDSGDPDDDTMEADVRDYCVEVNAKTDITLSGLTFNGAHSSVVYVHGAADHFTIMGCSVTNYTSTTGSGIWATGVLIEGGTGGTVGPGNTITYGGSGVTVEGWGTSLPANTTTTRNTIHDMASIGISLTNGGTGDPAGGLVERNLVYNCALVSDDIPGIGTYHVGAGTVIRYNVVHNCGTASARGSGINIDAHSTATACYYNVVYLNNYGGINATASGHLIYGNTCYHNNEGTADAGEISLFTQESVAASNCTIKNNILVASTAKHLLVAGSGNTTGHVIDYNEWYGGSATPFDWSGTDYNFANYKTASSQDAHSLNSDPLLTNAAGGDFTLQAGSPCINVGADLGATYQNGLLGSSVWPDAVVTADQEIYGTGWDIGAYIFESQSGSAAISGHAHVAAAGVKKSSNVAALSSAGHVVGTGKKTGLGIAAISAPADIVAVGTHQGTVAAILSAHGQVAGTGTKWTFYSGAVSTAGHVAATGEHAGQNVAVLSADGQVTATGEHHSYNNYAAFKAHGTVYAIGNPGVAAPSGAAAFSAGAAIVAVGIKKIANEAAPLVGGGRIVAAGRKQINVAILSAHGTVVATGQKGISAVAALSTAAHIVAMGVSAFPGLAGLSAHGRIAAVGYKLASTSAALSTAAHIIAESAGERRRGALWVMRHHRR
jgi:hypothetical protein